MKNEIFMICAVLVMVSFFAASFAGALGYETGILQAASVILAIPVIVFIHNDNKEFCKQLDRALSCKKVADLTIKQK